MAPTITLDSWERLDQLVEELRLSKAEYAAFCAANPELRIEREPDGHLIIMPPAHYRTGRRNAFITACISVWADRDGTGEAADSSTGSDLPDGSNRSPDAAWILKSRLAALSPADVEDGYLPLCPDFVIELRSKSDRLKALEQKMLEYIANGVRLGWLLDAENRTATICRPGEAPVHLVEPDELRGDPELPGFVLPLARVWA